MNPRTSPAEGAMEAALELLPLPMWLVGQDGVALRANASAQADFPALGPGDPLPHLLVPPDHQARLAEALHTIGSVGEAAVRGLTTGAARPGTGPWRGDLLLRCISAPGERVLAIAAFIDLTRELEREKALDEALARASDAALAKSDFVSAVSHELRTPLGAIVGLAQLMQARQQAVATAHLAPPPEWVAHLLAAARHLSRLVEDLLDQQALESGRIRIQCVDLPLRELVDDAVEMARHRFEQHGVRLLAEPVPGGARVHADPARARQVLLNLLDNAAKYTPRGRCVRLFTEVREGSHCVRVCDEGPGLTPMQQARLFQPFQRLGAERSTVPGLGLGLAISRQLAQRMGGQIGCDSAPGRGACFWFGLPAVPGS